MCLNPEDEVLTKVTYPEWRKNVTIACAPKRQKIDSILWKVQHKYWSHDCVHTLHKMDKRWCFCTS